ncbi:MerR family transcriptional regulator [Undibacterium pigrum]|uniref:DNA-binding transcriptional MerR regulator n=1 Tax=Undibacterium pigrum TaxID=401470 RepID=A0A318JHU0_9BURK|nr:MerR family transcriptional regulator [Undibacterium pigrum]PXX43228.1 DNA-binding transcriptional MerR regulator [Undibacterium pigrum]
MYIGELARLANASAKAIRLYENLGLLGQVQRLGKYRIYTERNVLQVQLIRQAQSLGFRLSELAPMLHAAHGEPDWALIAQHLHEKRAVVKTEIKKLHALDACLLQMQAEIHDCLQAQLTAQQAACTSFPVNQHVD